MSQILKIFAVSFALFVYSIAWAGNPPFNTGLTYSTVTDTDGKVWSVQNGVFYDQQGNAFSSIPPSKNGYAAVSGFTATFDANGNPIGSSNTLQPTNVNGYYGFVPPTQNSAGIRQAIMAAVASPMARRVIFECVTYTPTTVIPIIAGITYQGCPAVFQAVNGGSTFSKGRAIVGGTIFTGGVPCGSNNCIFWDGALNQAAVTGTISAQTSTVTSGSTTIAVPNGGLFTLNQRVYFTTAANGFYPGIPYLVLSISGNNITVGFADQIAIAATGTGTVTISAGEPNDATLSMNMFDLAGYNITGSLISLGAQNTFGAAPNSHFNNINVNNNTASTAYGFISINPEGSFYENFAIVDTGGIYFGSNYPHGTYQSGNIYLRKISASLTSGVSTNLNQQGLVFEALAGSYLNEIHAYGMEDNMPYIATTTQTTGALTNNSPNIPVTDSTKFNVGVPVWITTTANGFTQNIMYFVVSSAANVITISPTYGGTAQNSTGTSTMVINTQGYPGLQIRAVGAGASVLQSNFSDLDIEGNSSACVLIQNVSAVNITAVGQASTTDCHVTYAGRAYNIGFISDYNVAITDFDSNSSVQYYGQKTTSYNSWQGIGIWYDGSVGSGTYVENLVGNAAPGFPSLIGINTGGGGGWQMARFPVGYKVFTSDTSKTFGAAADAGETIFNGASGQTYTLPAVYNTSASNTNTGQPYCFYNGSTNVLTMATNGTQTFGNQTGVTSLSLPPSYWACAKGAITAGGTSFYSVDTNLPSIIAATVSSGCGTSPTVSGQSANAYAVTIGSTPGSTCVMTMPTAPHGWACQAMDITTQFDTKQTAVSTTSVTFTNYTRGSTSTANFTASDVVTVNCQQY